MKSNGSAAVRWSGVGLVEGSDECEGEDVIRKEFQQPKFKGYGPKASKNVSSDALIIEDWESDTDEEDQPKPKVVKKIVESKTVKQDVVSDGKLKKKTVFPTAAKIEVVKPKQQEKPVRKPMKYAEMYKSQKPRGNQINWNNQKSHQLGSDFVMNNKACFACGSFNHLIKDCKRKVQKHIWNNARRVNHHNSHRMSYPHPKRNFVPKAVLMKTGMGPVNAAKPKAAHNAVKGNMFNVVKTSACWMDAQAQGWQECSKEKEESREECSKSRNTKKMKVKAAAKIGVIQVKAVEETTAV
ncbi:retrotransposon ORF1 [Tanacetum coccineum]